MRERLSWVWRPKFPLKGNTHTHWERKRERKKARKRRRFFLFRFFLSHTHFSVFDEATSFGSPKGLLQHLQVHIYLSIAKKEVIFPWRRIFFFFSCCRTFSWSRRRNQGKKILYFLPDLGCAHTHTHTHTQSYLYIPPSRTHPDTRSTGRRGLNPA